MVAPLASERQLSQLVEDALANLTSSTGPLADRVGVIGPVLVFVSSSSGSELVPATSSACSESGLTLLVQAEVGLLDGRVDLVDLPGADPTHLRVEVTGSARYFVLISRASREGAQ